MYVHATVSALSPGGFALTTSTILAIVWPVSYLDGEYIYTKRNFAGCQVHRSFFSFVYAIHMCGFCTA
jgi:hypothetical protein